MEPSIWAPEHSDALREHLARGLSYAETARAINAKFDTHYSRNAAIGRAKRMGLAACDRPRDITPPAPRDQQPSVRLLRKHYAALAKWLVPKFEPVESAKLRCVDIEPRQLSLLELEPGDCRYPYGGDAEGEAITFCGHPQCAESSYCAAHFRLTLGPGALPERAVSTAPLTIVEAA
jgi:GcrA cell cycle regulator